MKENKKSIAILAVAMLVIFISLILNNARLFREVSSLTSQVSGLQFQLHNIENSFGNIETNIRNELEQQNSILTDYSISYGNADPTALTGDITISVVPKEYSESTTAAITLGDKSLPLERQGSTFTSVISVPIDIIYSKFTVEFKDGGTIRSEAVDLGKIGFVNELVKHTDTSSIFGMSTGKSRAFRYQGPVELYNFEGELDFSEVKLLAIKNGSEVVWETGDFTISENKDSYSFNIDETFTVEKENSLFLQIQAKDNDGFIYKYMVHGSEIYPSEGVSGASTYMEPVVCDAQGRAIVFKNH